jgi:hypothetical protein
VSANGTIANAPTINPRVATIPITAKIMRTVASETGGLSSGQVALE